MNCTALFLQHARSRPDHPALLVLGAGAVVTFGEMLELARRAQKELVRQGIKRGDSVLLVDSLGPRMYATVIASLALGASVILVEPWMPISKIERVLSLAQPKVFVTNGLGRIWGLRVRAVREIPLWLSAASLFAGSAGEHFFVTEALDADARGILTFTSGTTGSPKGVSRTHGRLISQHHALSRALESKRYPGADLCIFANFALSNMADGRTSIVVPGSWKSAHLASIADLPDTLQPITATVGPAFLLKMLNETPLPRLRAIHVGGALADCAIFERGFARWPEAHWTHVYGGSEAEPVSTADARKAVELSRARGYFQTLFIGQTVSEIRSRSEGDSLWVTGDHVCAEYVGSPEENRVHKRLDADGRTIWHRMGDRIISDSNGLWYSGRSGQSLDDFRLEQSIYSEIGSSKAFVVSNNQGRYLVGEKLLATSKRSVGAGVALQSKHGFKKLIPGTIYRDRRHRARIDRDTSLRKAAPWLKSELTQ